MTVKTRVHAVLAAAVLAACGAPSSVKATDLWGAQPAALDQPQINATFFLPGNSLPQIATVDEFDWDTFTSIGTGQVFTVTAYFDTGASGILLSSATAQSLNLPTIPNVIYSDVGVAGSDNFQVSQPVNVSIANYVYNRTDLDQFNNNTPVLTPYTPINTSPVNVQIGPYIRQTDTGDNGVDELGQLFDLLGGTSSGDPTVDEIGQLIAELNSVDVIGMPAMKGKVVVIDPTRVNQIGTFFDNIDTLNDVPDVFVHTYAYQPGTPFKPATKDTDPGIPQVNRHVKLSYASFDQYTQVTPTGSQPPTLAHNPFIGKDPVRLAMGIPQDDVPGIKISRIVDGVTVSSEGNWLLDTGAAASMISTAQAQHLGIHVIQQSNGDGTFTPVLMDDHGIAIPEQFTLDIGGIGGQTTVAGFYLDDLLVRTTEATAGNDNDPHNLHFRHAPVLVNDITVKNPTNGQTLTLDGVFGMNFLISSTPLDSSDPLALFQPSQGFFNWITFDEPNGILGLNFDPAFLASIGDVNGDGKIDALDLNALAGNWQAAGDGIPGDINGDGKVDALDLNLLAANWQLNADTNLNAMAAALVPEPASLSLLAGGASLLLLRRRGQRIKEQAYTEK
jgi:hypothetical protein